MNEQNILDAYKNEGLHLLRIHSIKKLKCTCGKTDCNAVAKHPAEINGVKDAKQIYDLDYFKIYNIGIACGYGGIVVIDVDPRNGGLETLSDLKNKYDEFPFTWVVETGGGGLHYYFKSDIKIPSKKLKGIDIQSYGKYVVAPASIHASGHRYKFLKDSGPLDGMHIEKIPAWFVEHLGINTISSIKGDNENISNQKINNNVVYAISDTEFELILNRLDKIPPGCDYDTWIKIGMALHGTGRKSGFNVWNNWSAKSKDKYNENITRKKWDSFNYKEKNEYGLGAVTHEFILKTADEYDPPIIDKIEIFNNELKTESNIIEIENKTVLEKNIEINENQNKLFNDIINNYGSKIIKELSKDALYQAPRAYPQFAISSALAIASSVVQAGFYIDKFPSINLSLYQWLIAPASGGKDFYRHFVESYIDLIDERLAMNKIGSHYGLRHGLYAFNSKIAVIDEMQDELKKFAQPGNFSLNQVLTELKELSNQISCLKQISLKETKSPKIRSPKISIFGLGTIEGFIENLTSKAIGGGLLSRFLIFSSFNKIERSKTLMDMKEFKHNNDILFKLKIIFERSLNFDGLERLDSNTIDSNFSKSIDHINLFKPPIPISFPNCEIKTMEDFRYSKENIYIDLTYSGNSDNDLSPGSSVDRTTRMAIKFAAINAIMAAINENIENPLYEIKENDVIFGTKLAQACSDTSIFYISNFAAASEYQRNMNKISALVKKSSEAVNRNWILRNSHISSRDLDLYLKDLCSIQKINLLRKDGEQINIDEFRNRDFPHGCKFIYNFSSEKK